MASTSHLHQAATGQEEEATGRNNVTSSAQTPSTDNKPPAAESSGPPQLDLPLSPGFTVDTPQPVDDEKQHAVEQKDSIQLTGMAAPNAPGTTAEAGSHAVSDSSHLSMPSTAPQDSPPVQSAIEPAKNGTTDDGLPVPGSEPAVYTTLCVANTENRHRWRITADYMRRRGEPVPVRAKGAKDGDELLDVPVAVIKRLLVADWRNEWESRPTDPSQIRLISMGEQLLDEKSLREHRFHVDAPARPILLSVRRPPEDDGDVEGDMPGKNPRRGSLAGEGRSRFCGCCTVM